MKVCRLWLRSCSILKIGWPLQSDSWWEQNRAQRLLYGYRSLSEKDFSRLHLLRLFFISPLNWKFYKYYTLGRNIICIARAENKKKHLIFDEQCTHAYFRKNWSVYQVCIRKYNLCSIDLAGIVLWGLIITSYQVTSGIGNNCSGRGWKRGRWNISKW